MPPQWYEDAFIVAPLFVLAGIVTVTVAGVILGVYAARLILRMWKD